ncbi:hypothetical protein BDD12DRAFT_871931 [Trichophaea hybrida]|nr:hypothetical protein BDD12DRAFT_871931 [Trichophaea hybrida]
MTARNETTLPYHPCHEAHRLRSQGFQLDENENYLPTEFPCKIDSPLVWKGEEIQSRGDEWMFQLGKDEVTEITAAMKSFQDMGRPLKDLSPETFSLTPPLANRFRGLANSLYDGVGFVVIRGIDPKAQSIMENIIIHVGLTSYVGTKRGYMGAKGNDVLAHIRDLKNHFQGQDIVTPSFTNDAMTFHTDLGDVVSIYVLNNGSNGGSFRIASSGNIYNFLRETRPDVLRTLSQPFVFDTLHPEMPSYEKPLLHYHKEKVFLQSFRRPFTGFGNTARSSQLPPITGAQMIALDELHYAALKDCFVLDFEDGDLLWFNNLALLHARDTYQVRTGDEQRHLLKMFVRDQTRGWEVPPAMSDRWRELYCDRTDPRKEEFPLQYPTEGQVPNYGWPQNG